MDNSTVCELPKYPGVDGRGAVILQYLEDTQEIAACGSFEYSTYSEMKDNSCYKLSGSSWQNMTPLINYHKPAPQVTKSLYLNGKGWFVFGQDQNNVVLSTEIFNGSFWNDTPATGSNGINLAYISIGCSVKLNDTHIMITGTDDDTDLTAGWILNLNDYSWTTIAPLGEKILQYGCVLTPEGEVLIAGGQNVGVRKSTVKIYNPATDSWRLDNNLPTDVDPIIFGFFNWNNEIYFATWLANSVWKKTNSGWEKTDIEMGASFNVERCPAILVPKHAIQCPTLTTIATTTATTTTSTTSTTTTSTISTTTTETTTLTSTTTTATGKTLCKHNIYYPPI